MCIRIVIFQDTDCNAPLVWPNYPVKVSVVALSESDQRKHVIEFASLHVRRYAGIWLAKSNLYMNEYLTV